jgi:hypothetical protein
LANPPLTCGFTVGLTGSEPATPRPPVRFGRVADVRAGARRTAQTPVQFRRRPSRSLPYAPRCCTGCCTRPRRVDHHPRRSRPRSIALARRWPRRLSRAATRQVARAHLESCSQVSTTVSGSSDMDSIPCSTSHSARRAPAAGSYPAYAGFAAGALRRPPPVPFRAASTYRESPSAFLLRSHSRGRLRTRSCPERTPRSCRPGHR